MTFHCIIMLHIYNFVTIIEFLHTINGFRKHLY